MAGPVKTLDVVPSASERPVIDGSAVDIEDGGEHFQAIPGNGREAVPVRLMQPR
jgi:hypothetical protein